MGKLDIMNLQKGKMTELWNNEDDEDWDKV
jgi:hypothetical protein